MARSVRHIVRIKYDRHIKARIARVIAEHVEQLVSRRSHVAFGKFLKIFVREYQVVAVYQDSDRSFILLSFFVLKARFYLLVAGPVPCSFLFSEFRLLSVIGLSCVIAVRLL